MNSKQKCIAKAYGEYWERTKDYINENGWLKIIHAFQINVFDNNFWEYSDPSLYRPKSLQGIENNNGWIKIESEDDLPKDLNINYWVMMDDKLKKAYYRGSDRWTTESNTYPKTTKLYKITHYQPIEKPNPPIY